MTQEITVHGTVADGFETVREEFAAVVAGERQDYEGQLCVYVDGRRVVDLWAGEDVTGDSLFGVYSAAKGATHMVVALLVQDGTLEPDRKVTYYWPEFGAEGKGGLTLRDVLSHRAGLIGTDTGFTLAELADDRAIAERLADQRPFWRPGTAFGYHALVVGALIGEVVRRATGRTVQEVYEERIRAPHGLGFHLGLPAAREPSFRAVQPLLPTPEQQALLDAAPTGPHTLTAIAFNQHGTEPTDLEALLNEPLIRAKGPASVGGVASARGLAGMYAAAVSEVDGKAPLLKEDTVAEFGQIHSTGHDLVARAHKSFGLGFQATADTWHPFLGAGTIGHSGANGTQAFADPRSRLAYGYTRRRFAFPGGAAPENDRLAQAAHRAAAAG
ncbi:EstA family serine hydrolase [Streptomyces pluripotens]|uniref:EstA family serine hydrolase n=1 Tax=Streptomyces pluripotens TaxID=1355015 RepID=A0A221NWN4_9ACTN|nr:MULTISPECIES: EstA family serine hydrolase [Streptomyces]ARP70064.1 EstA family serine hydrolase [Streptomyces pluripotens]ASN24324.1 EstA family serine hydrolase [Streptomyces pluripotens]KIE25351.1 beta-lactamase [Streptomyces sp. MUSC 125]MCH0559907.1 EstA family serine hydrolase [Streptomyces sp. MUM 16J]